MKEPRVIPSLPEGAEVDQVSSEGYSTGDLRMYYSGTLLLKKVEGGFVLCYVEDVSEEGFHCTPIYNSRDRRSELVPCEEMYRVILEQGYYHIGDITVQFKCCARRGHKKGLASSMMEFTCLQGHFEDFDDKARYLLGILEEDAANPRFISRRLCISDGKLWLASLRKTVGTYRDNAVFTPFLYIIDRVSQNRGDLECHYVP